MKQRVFLGVFALLGLGATLYNWHLVRAQHQYYPKLAIFAPMGTILFAAAGLFPGLAGPVRPGESGKKYAQGALLLIALAAGLLNWYAMARS